MASTLDLLTSQPPIDMLALPDGRRIAYRYRPALAAQAQQPTLVFFPGYASDMEGSKALTLDGFAAREGLALLRFDYSGCGSSEGEFARGTLLRWLEEALAVVDSITRGPLIALGSSMGGWLALHLALQRPDRVRGLIGIAAAPDFTDWGYTSEQKELIERRGKLEIPNPYGPEPAVTYREFWRSGTELRLLDTPIGLRVPVRLIHGDEDREVPVAIALKLLQQLRSADVQLTLVKGGGHRLSEPHELQLLVRTVRALLESEQ